MGFLDGIFEQPDELECPDARSVVAFARSIGAVPAYAYLGDVGESPTGDKKAEKFEDDFLEELLDYVASTFLGASGPGKPVERTILGKTAKGRAFEKKIHGINPAKAKSG